MKATKVLECALKFHYFDTYSLTRLKVLQKYFKLKQDKRRGFY